MATVASFKLLQNLVCHGVKSPMMKTKKGLPSCVSTVTTWRRLISSTSLQQEENYKLQVLTEDEVNSFDQTGYLVLRDFLTPGEKQNIRTWCDEIQGWDETHGKWFSYYEIVNGERTLCRTENFLPYHAGIRTLIDEKIVRAMSDCFQEAACLFKEKINYKLPNGGAFEAHQDAPAYVTYNQKLHVTALVAADPMTKENGCLEVVSGRHKEGNFEQVAGGRIHPDIEASMKWTPLYLDPGDIMIFNAFTPHRSDINRTNKARRVFYLTFNAISDGGYRRNDYYQEKRRVFPPEIEREPGVDYSEGAKVFNVATPITEKKHKD